MVHCKINERIWLETKKPGKLGSSGNSYWCGLNLRLCYGCFGLHVHVRTVLSPFFEHYGAIRQGEQRVVFAEPHIDAGVVLGAALPHNDVTRNYGLSAEFFYTESFTFRISTVFRATGSFFVCHNFNN